MPNTFITDLSTISINGIRCKLFVCINGNREADTCSISASVSLADFDLMLVTKWQGDAMLIPEGSIVDELDRQVALGSAEALLDTDNMVEEARTRINQLANLFANYLGVPDRPIGGV